MKIDIYQHKEKYLSWKKKYENRDIEEMSKDNSEIIKRYISDMEQGLNVSAMSAKESRSYIRLNNLKQRLIFLAKCFENQFGKGLKELQEEDVAKFFNGMRTGEIKRKDGKDYQSVVDFVKIIKAFWHWHMKINRKLGKEIGDITLDLDTSKTKPKWVYLNEAQFKLLCENAKYEYRVLITFLYDSGIRSPTELVNVRVSDLYHSCKELNIREEISKTFGRRIKLLLSANLLTEYISKKGFGPNDQVFPIDHSVTNRYLQRLAKRVLGDDLSEAGKRYSQLTLYDFRHCSCCYWLPRYKSESALKYRFGWKKSDKIHYYSELLGMKDTISEEDLLVDITQTEIEKRLTGSEKENGILKEKIDVMERKMEEIQKLTEVLFERLNK